VEPGDTGPLIPPANGAAVVVSEPIVGAGGIVVVLAATADDGAPAVPLVTVVAAGLAGRSDDPLEHPPASVATATTANAAPLVHEARLTLLEVRRDRLDLVRRADQRADGALLGFEAVLQADRAGQVEQRLRAPYGVG
jgi:hypothetical protein